MRTLVVGHVTHDYYEGEFVAGGCAFYGARVHQRLVADTRLVSVVGEDFTCDEAISDLNAEVVRRGETTTFANYYPAGRPRVQLLEARAGDVRPDAVSARWLDAELVQLAPVCGEVDLGVWLDAVGDGLVAINVQGWLKHAGPIVDPASLEDVQTRGVCEPAHRIVERAWEPTRELLTRVDIACLSEEDLVEQTDLLDRLVDAVDVVALTRGEKGSRIFVDGTTTEVGISPADVVDPTGAGDVYAAAFSHHVAAGTDPVGAARRASAAASIAVEGRGPEALERLGELGARTRNVAAPV